VSETLFSYHKYKVIALFDVLLDRATFRPIRKRGLCLRQRGWLAGCLSHAGIASRRL